jgi:hypothetical protein
MKTNIKNKLLLFLSIAIFSIISCKRNDGYNTPISKDKSKPAMVTNVKVANYNGGAYITYDLPNSENVLYILAKYQTKDGVSRETKSSYFSDTLNVVGFAKSQEYTVSLYTVSLAEVMSDPVTVKVNPLTPVYTLVSSQTTIAPDFGGVNIKALNPLKKEIGIIVTAFDKATGRMEVQDQHYTNKDTIDYSLRGYAATARDFGVYVTDKYGNISDTLKQNLTPYFEELLPKNLFSEYRLPLDTKLYTGQDWPVNHLWDGITDNSISGWHTNSGNPPPFTCTFNVGATYKLSRFVIWERQNEFAYGFSNPKTFAIWGSNKAQPQDIQLPLTAPEGTVVGDWINMGNFVYPNPPSGLPPGAINAADRAFVAAGVGFNFSISDPAIHFLRVAVATTWSGGDSAHIMELSFYGQPQ